VNSVPTTPKNGAVTCFGNSLQNHEFRELSLGRPGRQAGIRIRLIIERRRCGTPNLKCV